MHVVSFSGLTMASRQSVILTLSTMGLFATLSTAFFSVIVLNVIMLSVIVLNVIMLSVIVLNGVMLSVVAPC
jgi:hypothetical protein